MRIGSHGRMPGLGTAVDATLWGRLTEHLRRFRHPECDLVFCTPAGKPLNRTTFNQDSWWPACAAAAAAYLEPAAAEPDPDRKAELARRAEQLARAGTHDLRHFYASALIRHGIDVRP